MHSLVLACLVPVTIVTATFAGCERQSRAVDTNAPAPASVVSPPQDAPPPVKETAQKELTCPSDMVKVVGDYCEGVVHDCLKSKPGNGCVKFKPGKATCVGRVTHMEFCIDKYEWPNKEGQKPLLMQSWNDGQAACAAVGKRLCGDDEWTQACEGPEHLPYPYGWERDKTACNIDNKWIAWTGALASKDPKVVAREVARLDHTVPSGSFKRCVSPYGVNDMTGNADEETVNVTGNGKPFKSYLKGGHWVGGVRNRCRPATESHNETDHFYDFGFRCCAQPT